jgi:hypothetical protein
VKSAANGEHIVVLTATGQQVGKTYTLAPVGARCRQLEAAVGTREGHSWSVEYTEEGTAGRTRFVLSGPVPSAAPVKSNTAVVVW